METNNGATIIEAEEKITDIAAFVANLPVIKWDNEACCGYIIAALWSLGYTDKQIWKTQILSEIIRIFDSISVDDAKRIYIDF